MVLTRLLLSSSVLSGLFSVLLLLGLPKAGLSNLSELGLGEGAATLLQNPVPIAKPKHDDPCGYKMVSDKKDEAGVNIVHKFSTGYCDGGIVRSIWTNGHQATSLNHRYDFNPHTREYGSLYPKPYPSTYLEFYPNPDGPGYTWKRISGIDGGAVVETGTLIPDCP